MLPTTLDATPVPERPASRPRGLLRLLRRALPEARPPRQLHERRTPGRCATC